MRCITNELLLKQGAVPIQRSVETPKLQIAFLESGPADGNPVILMHGWPSDVRDWDDVAAMLAGDGRRVLVPWLRGFGPTRFLDPAAQRSGQQGAIAADLRDFMDALRIEQATLAGYDWGGRAACIVAALWPERVRGLVSSSYNIQNIAGNANPNDPAQERREWYQWYFNTSRGVAGLTQNREELARLLWRLWSPNWQFDDATFAATAASFQNPDFVDVTIHSYRHRHGNAAGDPAYDAIEQQLAAQPTIDVPTIVLEGMADGVAPPSPADPWASHFTSRYERRLLPLAGHLLSREAPQAVVDAIRDLV
jgi:pimeloyl-ACP methyl ester carboxylesterase